MEANSSTEYLIVGLACEDIIILVDHFPKEDEKLRCDGRLRKRGGNAGNSSTVMSLLGCTKVQFMGPLSSKSQSNFVISELEKYSVGTKYCIFDNNCDMTQSYILLCQKTGSRTIINYPALSPLTCNKFKEKITQDVLKNKLKFIHFEARWMNELFKILKYIESFNCDSDNNNDSSNNILVSIEIEKERLLNSDRFVKDDSKEKEKEKEKKKEKQDESKESNNNKNKNDSYIVNDLIFYGDLVFFSRQLIVNRGYDNVNGASNFIRDILKLYCFECDKMIEKKHESFTIIVPWGEKGCYGATINNANMLLLSKHCQRISNNETNQVQASKSFIEAFVDGIKILKSKSFPPAKVVDTLGAGDTFIASYLYAMLEKNMQTQDSMEFACKVAGFKVGKMGFDPIKQFQQ